MQYFSFITEWGITTEEKYHVPKRPIREIQYMDVPELMRKLKGKSAGTATVQEGEERRVRLRGENL